MDLPFNEIMLAGVSRMTEVEKTRSKETTQQALQEFTEDMEKTQTRTLIRWKNEKFFRIYLGDKIRAERFYGDWD